MLGLLEFGEGLGIDADATETRRERLRGERTLTGFDFGNRDHALNAVAQGEAAD